MLTQRNRLSDMSQRSYKASSPFVSTEYYYTSSALNLVIYYDENLNPDGNYNGYYISDEPIRTIFIPPSHWMGCTFEVNLWCSLSLVGISLSKITL